MNLLNRLFSWYGKRNVFISLAVIAVLLIIGVFVHFSGQKNTDEAVAEKLSVVSVVLTNLAVKAFSVLSVK